jgi:diketogulonate reductase-like aldo/keto reductase
VEAYSPIAHGEALRNEQIAAIADKYRVSVAQLCIKYVLALGAVALPKTANPSHMKDNALLDFTLSEQDMERLKAFTPIKDYGDHSRFPVFSGR